jgi:mono/diheme cytochrome c family protein
MMASNALRVLVPSLLLPALMAHAGGWAVITVDDLPDVVEATKPVTLSFVVRQHGVTLLDTLRPSIEAKSGRLTETAKARPTGKPGSYTASLTLPSAGDWSITIRSGFAKSDVTLLPLSVVEHGASLTRPVTDTERGERLFVAKGCVTCHVQIAVGPKLDGKRFDASYLAGFLANPVPTPSHEAGKPTMPNLGLKQREIASLVSYLNSNRQVGVR